MRSVLLALVALALTATPAAALPGDDPFAPLTPEDGAAFAPDPSGIPVTYTCPVYRISSAGTGFTVFGGPSDYGVSFATAPDLGTDGRLRSTNTVALDNGHEGNTVPEGQCTSTFAAGGSVGETPQETPGTYYWQVWRLCTGCEGSYETGPVRRLVLRLTAAPRVAAPARVYAGFAAAIGLRLDGVPDRAAVALQRFAGGRWRAVGTGSALDERGEVIATLPRGRQRLRAVVTAGGEVLAGPETTVTVRRARGWSTRPADDGTYTGKLGVRFRVTGGGRLIRSFEADVAMLCPGLVAGQLTTRIGRSFVKRIRIAPDGSFLAAASYGGDTTTLVRGRLRRGKVSGGAAELSLGACNGVNRFTARK